MQDMSDPERLYIGKSPIRAFLLDYFSVLDDICVRITSLASSDEHVVGEIEVEASYTGAPYSAENPRTVRLNYCVVDNFVDGQIVRERFYTDPALLRLQLDE